MKITKPQLLLLCTITLVFSATNVAVGITTPPNDDCSNAKNIGEVTNLPFNTTYATKDGPEYYVESQNIWYCYTASCNGCATVSLAGSSYDTKLAVYNGCGCPPIESNLIKCNDDYNETRQSQVTFPVTAGQKYLIEVGGYNIHEFGVGLITINCNPQSTPPLNDNCYHAEIIGNVMDKPFDTSCATFDGPGLCMTSSNIWYRYIAPGSGEVTVSLCGSSFDTMLAVYQTNSCYPVISQQIECNDDACGSQSEITFTAVAGIEYLIEVGGFSLCDNGPGVISIITEVGPGIPVNDNCYNAKTVGNVTSLPFDTTNATFDGPGQCMQSPNLWYCYTATATGDVTVSLCGSEFDTKLAVYNGCSCPPSTSSLIECNDDACEWQSEITFAAIAGHSYLIEAGGYGNQTGLGVLTITSEGGGSGGAPANDKCQDAIAVGNVTNLPFSTIDATFDGIGHCVTSPNIWYCYTATCTGDVTVSLCGSEFDTMLAVYDGCNCPPALAHMIECNDDFCGQQSQITFPAIAGNQYLIEIASYSTGYSTEPGNGVLTITCEGGGGSVKADDLGDAPDSTNNYGTVMTAYPMAGPLGVRANYPTVYDDGTFGLYPKGPIHENPGAVAYLGEAVTHENEADIGADQDGINNINPLTNNPNQDYADDGVIFPIAMPQCDWTTFNYEVTVVDPDVDLWVNVWCDFNRDGDWDDVIQSSCAPIPEWAVQNQLLFNLPVGLNTLTTPAFKSYHPKSSPEQIWMRITLSEQPWKGGENPGMLGNGGSGPNDGYAVGETEDLYFIPETIATICKDFNGDGVINMDDLTDYVNEWLANCD